MTPRKVAPYTLLLLIALMGGGAHADEFAERCAQLREQVKIATVFRDRDVVTDNSRNVQELNRLGARADGAAHNVYGLTYAKPGVHLVVGARSADAGDGRICAVPDIGIELGFAEFAVYLAKEIIDPCQQNIIRQHEQEHVNTWKSQLRASAQLLTTVLRRDMGEARYYNSQEEAEAGLRAWASELVGPWLKRMVESVMAAQASIDTQASYDSVTTRLRTCGQTLRGGRR